MLVLWVQRMLPFRVTLASSSTTSIARHRERRDYQDGSAAADAHVMPWLGHIWKAIFFTVKLECSRYQRQTGSRSESNVGGNSAQERHQNHPDHESTCIS